MENMRQMYGRSERNMPYDRYRNSHNHQLDCVDKCHHKDCDHLDKCHQKDCDHLDHLDKCHHKDHNLFDETMPIGMAYVPWQEWKCVYDGMEGLKAGTIFQELEKPYYGQQYCCMRKGERV